MGQPCELMFDTPDPPAGRLDESQPSERKFTERSSGAIMKTSRLLVLGLVTLMPSNVLRAQEPHREFSPHNGLSGHSEGNGALKLFFGRPRSFHVESYGYERGDGRFQLDQTVSFQHQRPQTRSWVITTVGSGLYTATLSDAAGAVTGRSDGSRLFLRYRFKGPLVVRQTLELMPDGKTIDNVGRATLLGIPVGHLHETIIRKN